MAMVTGVRCGASSNRASHAERGSAAAAMVMAIAAAIVAITLIAGFAGAAQARANAHGAADLAALSAADARRGLIAGSPCRIATTVAEVNGASLTGCTITGDDAEVTVRVEFLGALGVVARSRAGPPSSRA